MKIEMLKLKSSSNIFLNRIYAEIFYCIHTEVDDLSCLMHRTFFICSIKCFLKCSNERIELCTKNGKCRSVVPGLKTIEWTFFSPEAIQTCSYKNG